MCKSRGPFFHHPSSSKYVLPLSYFSNNSHFPGQKGRVDCALGKISCEAARGPVFHFWSLLISFCCEEWWKKDKEKQHLLNQSKWGKRQSRSGTGGDLCDQENWVKSTEFIFTSELVHNSQVILITRNKNPAWCCATQGTREEFTSSATSGSHQINFI